MTGKKVETLLELMARRDAQEKRQRGNSITIQRVHYRRISKAVAALTEKVESHCAGRREFGSCVCGYCELLARIDGDEL